jgi:hypothetical protein
MKLFYGRESFYKSEIMTKALFYLGLLQDDFADPYIVRKLVFSPGKLSGIGIVPLRKLFSNVKKISILFVCFQKICLIFAHQKYKEF